MNLLCDQGSFIEYDAFTEHDCADFGMEKQKVCHINSVVLICFYFLIDYLMFCSYFCVQRLQYFDVILKSIEHVISENNKA